MNMESGIGIVMFGEPGIDIKGGNRIDTVYDCTVVRYPTSSFVLESFLYRTIKRAKQVKYN